MTEEELIINTDALYKEEQTKDVRSIVSSIKAKRNLRGAHITYSQYVAEMSISYTDYLAESLNTIISYSEYLAENLK
jgi:hypothetical protein